MIQKQKVILRRKVMKLIIKQLEFVVYVKLKRIEIVFYKTGGLCKDCCSQKVSCPICNIVIKRSSLNKHKKMYIINQFQIYNNIFKVITNYKDYMRLHMITWIIMDYINYFNLDNPALCGIIMIKTI